MAAVADKVAGPNGCRYHPPGPFTTRLLRSQTVPRQSTHAPADIQTKRDRLKAIVSELGEAATPDQIREHAYRTGFGKVNSWMLSTVRNEVFPDRPRTYYPKLSRKVSDLMTAGEVIDGRPKCPACGSGRSRVKHIYTAASGEKVRRRDCQECGTQFKTFNETVGRGEDHPRRVAARLATEKGCPKCERVLPISCFPKKSGDVDLYRSECRECVNLRRARRQLSQTIELHGLTPADYDRVLVEQGGLCAICRRPNQSKNMKHAPLCFDHCHKTGRFRGLLCSKCNLGMGNFDDGADRLEAALKYLKDRTAKT